MARVVMTCHAINLALETAAPSMASADLRMHTAATAVRASGVFVTSPEGQVFLQL